MTPDTVIDAPPSAVHLRQARQRRAGNVYGNRLSDRVAPGYFQVSDLSTPPTLPQC